MEYSRQVSEINLSDSVLENSYKKEDWPIYPIEDLEEHTLENLLEFVALEAAYSHMQVANAADTTSFDTDNAILKAKTYNDTWSESFDSTHEPDLSNVPLVPRRAKRKVSIGLNLSEELGRRNTSRTELEREINDTQDILRRNAKMQQRQLRRSVDKKFSERGNSLPMNLYEVKQWLKKNHESDRPLPPDTTYSSETSNLLFDEEPVSPLLSDSLSDDDPSLVSSEDTTPIRSPNTEFPPVRDVEHLCALLDFYDDATMLTRLGLRQGEIPGLDVDAVQEIMQILQLELDSTDSECEFDTPITTYRKKCLLCLRRLNHIYQILPASLNLQDVIRDGSNPVGGGGFADIWRGTVRGQLVCLKVLRLVVEQDEECRAVIRRQFCKEALVWRQLRHPNILPLVGVNTELFFPSFCLVSPWMENKDILTYLKRNPDHDRHVVFREIAAGLHYLHSRNPPIVHGDIRGANILVTDDLRCCLADFGLALVATESRSWFTATTSTVKGAIRWMAPELIVQNNTNMHVLNNTSRDVYAFGCTIVEILTLQAPFHDQKTDAAVMYSLLSGLRPARPQSDWCSDRIWDVVTSCWTEDPAARFCTREIIEKLEHQ